MKKRGLDEKMLALFQDASDSETHSGGRALCLASSNLCFLKPEPEKIGSGANIRAVATRDRGKEHRLQK